MSFFHNVPEAPSWLRPECAYRVQLDFGQTAALDIDLDSPPRCAILGRLRLRAPLRPSGRERLGEPVSRALLERIDGDGYVSRCDLAADGSFALGCAEPGTHRLRVEAIVAGGFVGVVETITLSAGTRAWSFDPPRDDLRLLTGPSATIEASWISVRSHGPGDRVVHFGGATVEPGGAYLVREIPAGPVEVLLGPLLRDRELVGRTEIVAGKTVELRLP